MHRGTWTVVLAREDARTTGASNVRAEEEGLEEYISFAPCWLDPCTPCALLPYKLKALLGVIVIPEGWEFARYRTGQTDSTETTWLQVASTCVWAQNVLVQIPEINPFGELSLATQSTSSRWAGKNPA